MPNEKNTIVQIYEIQDTVEAVKMVNLGVDHIGSVLLNEKDWKIPDIKEVVGIAQTAGKKSSLIPLFNTPEVVFKVLDYYEPDIIHFCDNLTDSEGRILNLDSLIDLQRSIKKNYGHIKVMRSIPIVGNVNNITIPTLGLAEKFEPYSDLFLTDTFIGQEPVFGFIGITGKICDWKIARALVKQSRIPVILAGGISLDNVIDGIKTVEPFGVDSCTQTNRTDKDGVTIRFKKDMDKVKLFMDNVRSVTI
jgi:phosphoribosylanthranilate isomerase